MTPETMATDDSLAGAIYRLVRRLEAWGRGPQADHAPGPAGVRRVFTAPQRLALLAGFALLVAFRLPEAWQHGRFQGEEGTSFFAYAWHRPTLAALGHSFGGYLNIGANGFTWLAVRLVKAGVMPLEFAPYVTMIAALLFQLLPAALVLTARDAWLANRWAVIAALLLIAVMPMTEEVFLNTLHIQFHLGLCAGLILALQVPRTWPGRCAYGALLLLGPLCGPGAIVLLPLFALRSLVDRDRGRLAQTIVLAAGAAIQMLLFFQRSPVRGEMPDPGALASVLFVRLTLLPLTGAKATIGFGKGIYRSYAAGGFAWWLAVAGAAAAFGALVRLALRERSDPAIWLILAGLAIAVASFGGGQLTADASAWFKADFGLRYNFLPLTLLGMGLVTMAMRATGRQRWVCLALCLVTLYWGIRGYAKPLPGLRSGPAWSVEVARWRRDHAHPLEIWPAGWSVDLSDEDRPCAPAATYRTAVDPSYCETAWMRRVTGDIAIQKANR